MLMYNANVQCTGLEMPWSNCKVKLKLTQTKHFVLFVPGNDNANGNNDDNNSILTIKDTKLYVPVVTLSARHNQKLSKRLSKGFERSVYWNEYKTKRHNKNTRSKLRYFLESNFVGVNRLFALYMQMKPTMLKYLMLESITYQNIIM